ncbi:MAG: hypothetical protein DLM67_16655 [Candidatus Nephthysia bennettiae]|uniref:Uncharacterized protein n=1 Tax=Candidatus Nephthysia bennettiae TaxID=3127016 RepID=A0A934K7K3_9BACT|nr:hypothetical protein [Candidatus Dormibacteraeota bacterium]MBJ7613448.1 hypothetical protein [Candidatus Dormibacteraeota bacterium]PZR91118.1 MAG: hypothetical protein DLM67_16655 [Candidatus Dormibacteraeota bacterium]
MSDLRPGRQGHNDGSAGGAGWTDELAWLDAFEVAFRNLLAARSQVLDLAGTWDRSARLAELSAPLVAWLSECGRDEILQAIGAVRTGIEDEAGRSPSQEGAR